MNLLNTSLSRKQVIITKHPGNTPTRHMGKLLLVGSLILPAILIAAAPPAENQPVSLSVSTTANGPVMSITNNSDSPVTAFVVTMDLTKSHRGLTTFYHDVYCNYRNDHQIPKGASLEIPLPFSGQASSAVPLSLPTLQGVLFKSGATWGDAFWIGDILERRSVLQFRLNEAIGLLQSVSDQQLSKPDAMSFLQQRRAEIAQVNAGIPIERRLMHDKVIHMVIKNLGGDLRANGKVPEFSAVLSHLSRFLKTWHSVLQLSNPSPVALSEAELLKRATIKGQVYSTNDNGRTPSIDCNNERALQPALRLASWSSHHQSGTCHLHLYEDIWDGPDNCGNTEYVLSADINGVGLTTYGFWPAYGVCTGGFYDCQDTYSPPSAMLGTADGFEFGPIAGVIDFYWELDNWFNEDTNCTQCDPNPSGFTQVQIDIPISTPIYQLSCPS
jgi:hypothetical protein